MARAALVFGSSFVAMVVISRLGETVLAEPLRMERRTTCGGPLRCATVAASPTGM
jgi:hypothetical protein